MFHLRTSALAAVLAVLASTVANSQATTTNVVMVKVPKGAIVAFALLQCPKGWEEYTKAQGRVLMGVGPVEDSDLEVYLEEREGNIQHDHGRTRGGLGAFGVDDNGDVAASVGHVHEVKPIEALPPFVGVLFCIVKP